MKRFLAILIAFAAVFSTFETRALAADAAPDISAAECVLIHCGDGEVLYSKDADRRALIASTTKIMTAIVVIENCDADEVVEIKPEYCGIEGSSMYLKAGEKYTVEQLLNGMMLNSGNDAAVALACYTAGSVDAFAAMMNEKAKLLGLTGSSFKNPNGLDEEGHYSTAGDLARLTVYCMADLRFKALVSTKSSTVNGKTYVNHNKLLWNCPGCIGVKTGYTLACGRSLVSCCERDGMRLVCVTLGDPDDWRDHQNLYDWAFENYGYRLIIGGSMALSVPVVSGTETAVPVRPSREIRLFLPSDARVTYTVELPRFVFAGVNAGDEAGRITAYVNGEQAASAQLVYGDSVAQQSAAKVSSWAMLSKLGERYFSA